MAVLSTLGIALDSSTRLLNPTRGAISTMVAPLYFIAESPYLFTDVSGEFLISHSQLRQDNEALRQQILQMSEMAQQLVSMQAENERLRQLLGSHAKLPYEVLIAELVGIVPSANTFQVIVDKGADANIEVGQAVLDAQGLFGQIVEVGEFTSRVLLITDTDHAIPIQVHRNGVRSIAGGTGSLDLILLENVPVSADIVEGDLIETSGLGGRFPVGYPVGTVQSVVVEPTSTYAEVTVRPLAQLDRSRHVLVVFDPEEENPSETEEGSIQVDDV